MDTKFLLSNKLKNLGWLILILSFALWLYAGVLVNEDLPFLETKVFAMISSELFSNKTTYFSLVKANLTYTLIGSLFIVGGLLVAFSREKVEDEFIAKLRLQSFQWSFLINYVLLLLAFLFIYGSNFITVLIYNMFTMLILFILRFHYLLFKYKS